MNTIVYIVIEAIDYDGIRIRGVFSTSKGAQIWIDINRKDDWQDFSVEEYELDV